MDLPGSRPCASLSLRRVVASCLLVAGLIGGLPMGPVAAETRDAPLAAVDQFYAALLDSMQNAKALGAKGRYDKLAPVIAATFDAPAMAKLATGPSWDTLPPEQQQAITSAFLRFTAASYASRFDGFSGEKFEVTGAVDQAPDKVVQTKLNLSNGKVVTLNYLVRKVGAVWKIEDIYLGGTISELASRRAEFGTILKSGGPAGLVASLGTLSDKLLAAQN